MSGERHLSGASETQPPISTTAELRASLRPSCCTAARARRRRDAIAELPPRRKQQIEAFLMSLVPPGIER